jgi:hypothetical protein
MQNPRGSNNRLNEANTNRNNANRLCDTQNNGKGGYCWGPPMSFYEGSYLVIEWTAQHGCGNPRLECNIVIQYMCTSDTDAETVRIRDGTTTDTIPNDPSDSQTRDGNGNFVYGMHENYEYYQQCSTRNRNLGLFVADRPEVGGLTEVKKKRKEKKKKGTSIELFFVGTTFCHLHPTKQRRNSTRFRMH